jgi:hypothetical protein
MLLALLIISSAITAQDKSKDCKKPPKIITQLRLSRKDQQRWKKVKLRGRVALEINETGEVSSARVLEANPKDGADALLRLVQSLRFQPRWGCGILKTEMFFSPSD